MIQLNAKEPSVKEDEDEEEEEENYCNNVPAVIVAFRSFRFVLLI